MSLKYTLDFSNQASNFLKKLTDRKLLEQLAKAFEFISENPYSGKFLQGELKGFHSYRLRDYRIIYKIIHHKLLIYIEDIAHRRESYK